MRDGENRPSRIRALLRDDAERRGEDFNLVLNQFALERLLYRLSISEHRDQFVLKGALLFRVWETEPHRPTRDADFLAYGPAQAGRMTDIFRSLCEISTDDGVVFDAANIRSDEIREGQGYPGIRIRLQGELAGARVSVQIDIGFGDDVTPNPEEVELPTMLDLPAPRLRGYPIYTVLAEKLEAMVRLDLINSRMKDFFDCWALSQRFSLDGALLREAIERTFARRATPIPEVAPTALTSDFVVDANKQAQWRGFTRRIDLQNDVNLDSVIEALRELFLPVIESDSAFSKHWPRGGPWEDRSAD